MRASLGRRHKALVEVLGLAMLERNILSLLSHGFHNIVVVVGAAEKRLISFTNSQALRLAGAAGAHLKLHIEKEPLGTIGAARAVGSDGEDLLVVNVDNLTCLDLSALLAHHQTKQVAMTIATHNEPFQIPFGQVSTDEGMIVEYKEKPVLPVQLSSGTYVLGPAARQRIPFGKSVGVPDLVSILLKENLKISAYPHSSLWIDVNDSAALGRAEAMIAANYPSFELWSKPAEHECVTLAVVREKEVAVARAKVNGGWVLPLEVGFSKAGEPIQTALRIRESLELPTTRPLLVTSFDELEQKNGERVRHHLFSCKFTPRKALLRSHKGIRWLHIDELSKSHGATRTLAYLKRYAATQNSHSFSH